VSDKKLSSLQLRVISASVLAPVALGAIYLGDVWFALFMAICTVAMTVEWCRASFIKNISSYKILIGLWLLVALYLSYEGYVRIAFISVIVAALAVIALTWFAKEEREWKWAFLGPLYIGIPVLSLLELRGNHDSGMMWTLSLFLIVWATDTGAYFSGKTIGGPKIAPSISPNKTWAGLIGGMICSAIVAVLANEYLLMIDVPLVLIAVGGALLAVLAQIGDFAESGWKRHFDIKDASNLIPGHGGVLDRLDGVLFVVPALHCIKLIVGN
jgi:phosphatidate cytidylyltransferase